MGNMIEENVLQSYSLVNLENEWSRCDALLKEKITLNQQVHRSIRRKVSEILKEVAKETGRSFRSVQARYYAVVRRELLSGEDVEAAQREIEDKRGEMAVKYPTEEYAEKETEGRGEAEKKSLEVIQAEQATGALEVSEASLELPRVGDIVQAKVTNVIDYGVFVQAEAGYQGFIRVGEVTREEWLSGRSDLERYFYPGEVVRVKVVAISDGKVYFSCKALGGKKPHGLLPFNGQALKISRGSTLDKELQELVHLLSLRVGKVSEKAREGLGELMLTHGVVRVTSRLFELLEEWDQSLGIVKELKELLDGEYNRAV